MTSLSVCQVITSNVGMKLGHNKAEELLNIDDVTSMDFTSFFDIVKTKLVDAEKRTEHGNVTFSTCAKDVIKTCFKLCDFTRHNKSASFTSEHCLLLWRLFNFLSETDDNGSTVLPVQLDPEEASLIFKEFIEVTGQRNKQNAVVEFDKEHENKLLSFSDFLNLFEKEFIVGLSMKDISQGLKPIYDRYIMNVMEKGKFFFFARNLHVGETPTHLDIGIFQNEHFVSRPTGQKTKFKITYGLLKNNNEKNGTFTKAE